MLNPINSILHSTRNNKKKLNILCAPTHEEYETKLTKTGHAFYSFQHPQFKTWNDKYRDRPSNYNLLSGGGLSQIPPWIDFDLVLSQNKFGQYQVLAPIAKALQIPLISLEHTLPIEGWSDDMLIQANNMRGFINVFISEYSIGKWKWVNNKDTVVIHHAVDTDLFKSTENVRINQILSVNNDFINRDHCLNFQQFMRVTQGLPVKTVGDTPGLSKAASSVEELISFYQSSSVFLNTAHVSPIPSVMMEAAACGCGIVSCRTCAIPNYFTDKHDILFADSDEEMRKHLIFLLNNPAYARTLGNNARKTMIEKFGLNNFINNWNKVFYKCVHI